MAGLSRNASSRSPRKNCRYKQGSLYSALHRLEQQGWIKAHWGETEGGRKAKFYSLTRAGKTQMEKELANWDRLSSAINLVVQTNEA